jgi:hypothetical protein
VDFYKWLKCQWDRAAAVAAGVLGLVALLLGWLGVSRSGLPAEQIPYLASGAVLGLFALGIAATLWLSADLRDEWRKLDLIHRDLSPESEPAQKVEASSVDVGEASTGEWEPEPPVESRGPNGRRRPLRAEPVGRR